MTQGKLFPIILSFAATVTLTGVLQLLFNAADLIVVGRFGSPLSIGAVGSTGSLVNLIVSLFVGLSLGSGVTVAQAKGAGNNEKIFRAVHTAIPVAIISGIIVTLIGQFFSRSMLAAMDSPEDIIDLSALYLRIYFWGVIPMLVYNFGASILRAVGDTRHPLIFLVISGAANFLMNLLFVIVFKMDVAGVALATTISQFIAAALVVTTLRKREDACRLFIGKFHIYKEELKSIITIGLPAGFQGSLFAISNVIIQSSINSFGSIAVAGNAAAANIEGFIWWLNQGIAQAGMNFSGQNLGAKKFDRVNKTLLICLICVIVTGTFSGIMYNVFGKTLLGIYIKNSPEAIEYGLIRVFWIGAFYATCGLMDVMTGTLRGLGRSVVPMIVTVVGVCVARIIWIYTVFAVHRTLEWLFVSYPISWTMTFAVELLAFFIVKKKLFKDETSE